MFTLSNLRDGAVVIDTNAIPGAHHGEGSLVFAMGGEAEADPLLAEQRKVAQFVVDACNEKIAREAAGKL
jgi:hypothetical protein